MDDTNSLRLIIFLLGVIAALLAYCWTQLHGTLQELKAGVFSVVKEQARMDKDFSLEIRDAQRRLGILESRDKCSN